MKVNYIFLGLVAVCHQSLGWSNGPSGNAQTNTLAECSDPPYATHDYIADHGLMFLPAIERDWLMPFRSMYLLGTEAPDNKKIPEECGAPNTGYDDRRHGHSVEWAEGFIDFIVIGSSKKDRAAVRAQEEYDKAVLAYDSGKLSDAAFYLGAMAHYIGDASQYGHAVPFEIHHSDYEDWAKDKTTSFDSDFFLSYMEPDQLVKRKPYTAVKMTSKLTAGGKGRVLHAGEMDSSYSNKDQRYIDSVGISINYGANQVADVLHTFYLNVIMN